jgi:hypothetical protein
VVAQGRNLGGLDESGPRIDFCRCANVTSVAKEPKIGTTTGNMLNVLLPPSPGPDVVSKCSAHEPASAVRCVWTAIAGWRLKTDAESLAVLFG